MTMRISRLAALRQLIQEWGGDGFLIPRTDAYHGEHIAPCDERLAWLTGFTGSAGTVMVLQEKAAIFVDGRYTLQVEKQVHPHFYEICSLMETSPCVWARQHLKKGQKIFYDPWLLTLNEKDRGEKTCEAVGASLIPVSQNPIDLLWEDRPVPVHNPVQVHDVQYAGVPWREKIEGVVKILQEKQANAVVLSDCESIAWLLNIRGNDISYTPVVHGLALVWADKTVDLFINSVQISSEIERHFGNQVRLHDDTSLMKWLGDLQEKVILLDPALVPVALIPPLEKCRLVYGLDPCALPKAVKNVTEVKGAYHAHLQDGIAVTRFLAWLSRAALTGQVTEQDAANKLLFFRQQNPEFRGPSFATISGAGPNSAIVHYHATPDHNYRLEPNSLFLIDSGGQYLTGTTDITRTVAIGTSTDEQKDRFTRVLKGHIALATAQFPVGTTGSQLDSFARQALWQAGIDYNHGTGHGVGSYLNVHEGPQRISKAFSSVPLQPGMIVSNEPGYYKSGAYGIRIETLVIVVEKGIPEGGELPLLGFETLTLAPLDMSLVVVDMLTREERSWLNAYHAHVCEMLLPHLNTEEGAWLKMVTKEI